MPLPAAAAGPAPTPSSRLGPVRSLVVPGAVITAQPEHLQRVVHVGEAVLVGDRVHRALELRGEELHRAAAFPAHQVVVVPGVLALAVQRFAVPRDQHVARGGARERWEVAVYGRQAHRLPVGPWLRLDLLGAAEVVLPRERLQDRGALAGVPLHTLIVPPGQREFPSLVGRRTRGRGGTAAAGGTGP